MSWELPEEPAQHGDEVDGDVPSQRMASQQESASLGAAGSDSEEAQNHEPEWYPLRTLHACEFATFTRQGKQQEGTEPVDGGGRPAAIDGSWPAWLAVRQQPLSPVDSPYRRSGQRGRGFKSATPTSKNRRSRPLLGGVSPSSGPGVVIEGTRREDQSRRAAQHASRTELCHGRLGSEIS